MSVLFSMALPAFALFATARLGSGDMALLANTALEYWIARLREFSRSSLKSGSLQ